MLEQQINLYKNFTKGRIHYTIQLFEIIKITNHAEAKKQPTQTENITEVHFLDAPRKSVSFKCNERLWKSFVSTIKAQGLSVCHVMEGIIYGYLYGTVHLGNTIKPLKIENLVVERAVKRVRRYAVEEVGVDKGERWYCALGDGHVPFESLPLAGCNGCPNGKCREFILKLSKEGNH